MCTMKIASSLDSSALGSYAQTSASSNASTQEDFQTTLNKAMGSTTSTTTSTTKIRTAAEKAKEDQAAEDAARADFLAYMNKTPAQRMREAVMKELGYTEASLQAMSPKERVAAEAAIAEKIKERMLVQAQEAADKRAAKAATAKL